NKTQIVIRLSHFRDSISRSDRISPDPVLSRRHRLYRALFLRAASIFEANLDTLLVSYQDDFGYCNVGTLINNVAFENGALVVHELFCPPKSEFLCSLDFEYIRRHEQAVRE